MIRGWTDVNVKRKLLTVREDDDLEKLVGRRMRELRERRGWSRLGLLARIRNAGPTDLSEGQIGFLERGERRLRVNTLKVIANALEVPVAVLLAGTDAEFRQSSRGGVDPALVAELHRQLSQSTLQEDQS